MVQTTSTELTVEQAAKLANVTVKSIRRWLRGEGRLLPARVDAAGIYHIDMADLERAMRNEPPPDGQQVVEPIERPTRALMAPALAKAEGALATALAQAVQQAVADPLLSRLERQAQRIGELEAQLAIATAPKPPRPSRRAPARPRLSVPADDPDAALAKLIDRYGPAQLAAAYSRCSTQQG